jgi:hypothetical protein
MPEAIARMKRRSFREVRDSRLHSHSMRREEKPDAKVLGRVARAAIQPGAEPMHQARPMSPEDPFPGLLLPIEAWKAIDAAHITSLEQLKGLASRISGMSSIAPDLARIIQDRLDRLAAKRMVRARLIFPKRAHCKQSSTRMETRQARTQ